MSLEDLAIVVWIDPDALDRPQKRLLETITSRNSRLPLAFPIRSLQLSLPYASTVTEDTLQEKMLASTKESPIIIPISLARSSLGWTEFDIAGEERSVHD